MANGWQRNSGYRSARSNFGSQNDDGPAWQTFVPQTPDQQKALETAMTACAFLESEIRKHPVKTVGHSWIIAWKRVKDGIIKVSQTEPQNGGVDWFSK